MTDQNDTVPDTVVLIHGLWMTALCWENWVKRYEARGYRVLARSWPDMEGGVDALRADPSGIESLGIEEIVDFYDAIVRRLDDPPIIMGHSFGGAFTEILLDRGLGGAGVAIDAAAVQGIRVLPFSQLCTPASRRGAVALTEQEFRYAFGNTMSEEDSRAAWQRYAVPGPGRVLLQGALATFNPHAMTRLDFENPDRAPLLLIDGGAGHAEAPVLAEYKEFPGRSHFTIGEPGWEEVADYALAWAVNNARVAPAPSSIGG
jgi:pimeloyl-ACP methyl ester carboxylesterase